MLLDGDWRGAAASAAALPLAPAEWWRDGQPAPRGLQLSAGPQLQWDAGLPALLWHRLADWPASPQAAAHWQLQGLPPGLAAGLQLALAARSGPAAEPPGAAAMAAAARPWAGRLTRLGEQAQRQGRQWHTTVGFVGEVLLALGRQLAGRGDMRGSDLLLQLLRCGPQSLPIVALTCALVGLMLAYMGGAQLDRIGAQPYIAAVVSVGMVRELAGLMVGVILAGRLGAAFAAQLGSMAANEEIDALRVLGVEPVGHLVLPRLLALLLMAPVLWAYAALVGVLAGLPAAVGVYGLAPTDYLHQAWAAMNFTHLWIGLFKCCLYLALLTLAGCREGFHAGHSTEAVGDATTAAVVKALVWIIAAATVSTMVFQSFGL